MARRTLNKWFLTAAATAMIAGMSLHMATAAPLAEAVERSSKAIEADTGRLIEMYKDIHQNPELGFMEKRTSAIVAKELEALGFEVKTGIGGTGVVGILKNGDGPTVMYRADMDANAVEEATGLPYASKVRVLRDDGTEVPVAHMCGHDAHVTWMLGMAKTMVAMKDAWSGTMVLVGQPAEEPITGAQAMIDAGMYDKYGVPKPDFFIGIHTAPGPVGMMMSSAGPKMAGTDQIDILFRGVGGHGSMPQMTKDPVVMASLAVLEYQAIVSRTVTPQETAVLTVGSVQAGADNNVIPATALLKANLRWYNPQVREQMIAGIKAVSNGIARTYGMPEDQLPVITMKGGSTPLVNDKALAERLAATMKGVIGDKNVVTEFPPATGSEDVHLLLGPYQDVPFDYMIVGVADPKVYADAVAKGLQFPYSAHNPNFVVDLKAIPFGTKIATVAMLDLLGKPAN
ncbi:amidohydrolase [Mesorhizobium sp. VK25A]|uniref:Amidohydrolase n=1 Tax=Mesorhizobium vachelliae TaxID=3072309 RepID=A0ABU4ZZ05_9HYPH|nr:MULTISPECIES: amidohydrolase [unclassified Mesorhizobium]MDX8529539.1 amidohydrolase [Mesorhizobium sp. VK25D]MDX8545749.1 amidohydrolase [Mesorhizobium sp. VK25A]